MSLDPTELGGWIEQLTADPLDPFGATSGLYQPLEHAGRDPVNAISSTIRLALRHPTTQLLSGPSGSGKTTELLRLKGTLEQAGYAVVLIDTRNYINQSAPVDITDVLITIALGASEQLAPDPGQGVQAPQETGFLERLRGLLQRVKLTGDVAGASGELSSERVAASFLGVGVEVDLRRELKSSPTFIDELRLRLAPQVGQLYEEVAAFLRELIGAARDRGLGERGVVVIADSLEQVRGTAANDREVQESVERLFVYHSERLRFASHHTVYTVPSYLAFTDPGQLSFDGTVRQVSIPWVRNRRGERDQAAEQTIATLIAATERRIPWPRLLGEQRLLEQIILASGGHLRDLWWMLRELITLAFAEGYELPVDAAVVEKMISGVTREFSQITKEDADFLRGVTAQQGRLEPAADDVHVLARLMHTHMILAHLNNETWYEVHPLARRGLGQS